MWLVTNRHVVIPENNGVEFCPSKLTFYLRKICGAIDLVWEPISLSTEDIENLARFHPNKSVDVAAINVIDIMNDRLSRGGNYARPFGLTVDDFPGENSVDIHVASDIIVVGYPRGFYDSVNLFPIVKSGIVASRWGVGFEGHPYFLIDAKLFPGSSGSVVLSKPNDLMVKDGEIMFAREKQVSLLGIFSGEPKFEEMPVQVGDLTLIQRSGFNLGVAWYANVIEDIVNRGISLHQALANKSQSGLRTVDASGKATSDLGCVAWIELSRTSKCVELEESR